MKKLLAILLAVALLLPMGVVAQAEEVEKQGFYLVNWGNMDTEYSNVFFMPYLWTNGSKLAAGEANAYCPALGGSTIPALAENLKAYFDNLPAGARYINFTMIANAFEEFAEDACILDKAIPIVQNWVRQFAEEFHRIGGKLDGLVIDTEYLYVYQNYIHDKFYTKDPLIYDKIVKNPVYQEKIRPQLVDRGFKFYDKITPETPEIYSIHPKSGDAYAVSRSIWNTVMINYSAQCVTDICSPIWEYYPDAIVSDYQVKSNKTWLKTQGDKGGSVTGGGNYIAAGNCSNENFYFNRPNTIFYTDPSTKAPAYKTVVAYNNAVYENTSFYRCMYDVNMGKNAYLSDDNGNVNWWMYHSNYVDSKTAYYAETIYHLGLLDPSAFLGYILMQDLKNDIDLYEKNLQIANDCLADLSKVAGYADRKPIAVNPTWNSPFILSGMYAGGRNIWRLTPDKDRISLEDFKVEGTDPTFSFGGETITFPGGKIIESGKITDLGSYGYWIETAKDVTPVIQRAENYFREYPEFQENYEAYEIGTAYNYDTPKPAYVWEPKKTGSASATIEADSTNANNKVLAVKGTYTFKNVKMPDNITAGDTYAENQAWEVSFILPGDMAENAELVLLNGTGGKKASKDGGFKIAGGKVYYSQGEEYVEMKGVSLDAGTKYTVVRDMDFNNAEAITCDYYVYDAERKLLGKAMDIAVASIVLPVSGITIGCTNVAGDAVLLDDYKLYPTSVATDFYLYDAKTGMPVKDLETARDRSTAYRLSWLNGTQKEKTYSVVAAYYNGETLASEEVVKEIKMGADCDGVVTGIVETKEGQTVRVYLRNDNSAGGDSNDDGKANNDLIIIIAAAAAALLVLAVVIVVVVVSSKKKKAAAPATEAEIAVELETAEEAKSEENEETTNE